MPLRVKRALRKRIVWVARLLLLFIGFWLFNVSTPGNPTGCLTTCAPTHLPATGAYTAVTWNILHGFPDFEDLPARLDQIAAIFQATPVDFLLLQEIPHTLKTGNTAAYLAEKLGLNYVYARANGNRFAIGFEEGEAVLSRYPLSNAQVQEFSPSAGFFENRIVLRVEATTPDGVFTLLSTHLTNGKPAINAGQAADLRAIVGGTDAGLAIIGGDFNARPDSPQIVALSADWQDSFTTVSSSYPDATCCLNLSSTTPTDSLHQRIDYLFFAPGSSIVTVLGYQTLPPDSDVTYYPSDHLGVRVTFTLGSKP